MEITQEKNEVFKNSSSEDVSFRLKNELMFIDLALSKMYSNPIKSIVREIISNAVDSHTRSNTDKKIHVLHPTRIRPEFVVQDFGIGMSEEELRTVYCVLGESTKNNTNSQIGGFGLGAKSPFAYSDAFSLVSRKDGVEISCIVYRDENNCPQLNLTSIAKTKEPSGFQVSIPVRQEDVEKFRDAIDSYAPGFTRYLEPTSDIKPLVLEEIDVPKDTFREFKEKFRRAYLFYLDGDQYNFLYISINGVFYTFDEIGIKENHALHNFLKYMHCVLVFEFETGFLSFTPTRESFVSNKVLNSFKSVMAESNINIEVLRRIYEKKVIEIFESHLTQTEVASRLFSQAYLTIIAYHPKTLGAFDKYSGSFSKWNLGRPYTIDKNRDFLLVYDSKITEEHQLPDLEYSLSHLFSKSKKRKINQLDQVIFFFPNLKEYEVLRFSSYLKIKDSDIQETVDLSLTNKNILSSNVYPCLSVDDFVEMYYSSEENTKPLKEKKKLNYKKLYRKKVSAIAPYELKETGEEIDLDNFDKIRWIENLTMTDFLHAFNKAIEMNSGSTYYILYDKKNKNMRFLQAVLSLLIKEGKLPKKTHIIFLNKDMRSNYQDLEAEGFFDLENQWISFYEDNVSEQKTNFFYLFFESIKSFVIRHFGEIPDFSFKEKNEISSVFIHDLYSSKFMFSEKELFAEDEDKIGLVRRFLIAKPYSPFSEFIKIISFISDLSLVNRTRPRDSNKAIADGESFNDFILFLNLLRSSNLSLFPQLRNTGFFNNFSFNLQSLFLARKTLIEELNKFQTIETPILVTSSGDLI